VILHILSAKKTKPIHTKAEQLPMKYCTNSRLQTNNNVYI
jgi:hypothetical protein